MAAMLLYSHAPEAGKRWSAALSGKRPAFACAIGFTETCLIPGISAAGLTPDTRRFTAIGDGEVLLNGYSRRLPTAPEGYPSPVVISKAVIELLQLPVWVLDAGLSEPCPGAENLGGAFARCLSTGQALDPSVVSHLFNQGLLWGERLAAAGDYLVIGECVAGGTTTALAVLRALGYAADGLVNSSHPQCNHRQKQDLVTAGLARSGLTAGASAHEIIAAVGDPVQPVIAGMALAASNRTAVLLAGGTQMLAIVALMRCLAREAALAWQPEQVVVGTTRWVAADPTADAALLAERTGSVPMIASGLSFAHSVYPALQAYERGYVKEGVGAGGLAIAAHLAGVRPDQLLNAIESVYARLLVPPALVNP